jgi:hypothetical protein
MWYHRQRSASIALFLGLWLVGVGFAYPAPAEAPACFPSPTLPAYLPRYRVDIDLDTANRTARVHQAATWTNPTQTPSDRLVFNVHSRYVVPDDQIGFMAKMLEILRVQPSEALGYQEPSCQIFHISLVDPRGNRQRLSFHFEGETKTTLVVSLPGAVGPGESVTLELDLTMHLPAKQGRWGQWEGVTTLCNWLPVFAHYGSQSFGPKGKHSDETRWQPVPFTPWHQPFFNEAGNYDVHLTLACDQNVASTGTLRSVTHLPGGKKRLHIEALGVREFTLLCSSRYRIFEGQVAAGPNGAPVRVQVLAFAEHEFYARQMVRIACESLAAYSKWLGPYPWQDFTVAEAFFGWNGNECSNLVMIDERVFAMPRIAVGYIEYLLSHEVCHQWWYNLVGTNGHCETWMDEGLANYFSHRLLARRFGKNNPLMRYPSGLEWLPNIHRDDYRSAGMYSTLGKGELGPVIQEMPKFGHLANLFNICYDKGGRIVGMIEERLGEAAFFDLMRIVVRKYRHRILSVTAFQRELELYTGQSWEEFFDHWLYQAGMSDWAVEKVTLTRPPACVTDAPRCCPVKRKLLLARGKSSEEEPLPSGKVRLHVIVHQKAEYDEPTTLGIALQDHDGYIIRIPILPGAQSYRLDDPPTRITPLERGPKGGARFLVEVVLPGEPTQVSIDPDQVLVDAEPANNYWHPPVRWRITPLYTFLEETDLTNAYDRWNIICGPWLFTPPYENAWFTRPTMLGARAGLYRTQQFSGGIYSAFRSNWRDVVAGVDGQWEHWPFANSQVGFVAERRLMELNNGDTEATRGVLWGRYIFTYGSSLYLPPIHFIEAFAQYSDNFLPFPTQSARGGVRYDRTSTLGLHYRLNYLTPYWDPEGGFSIDAWYEGGIAEKPSSVGVHKIGGQFTIVKSAPSWQLEDRPIVQKALDWFGASRFAFRAYGATAAPSRGEFFSMGGSDLFRGFDLAQRQGSTVWVGSVEWRVPFPGRVNQPAFDHLACVRHAYAALFYDVGDAITAGHSAGPVAHSLGVGLRWDVSWFSFVERTTLRFDIAKTVNLDTGVQVWLGVNHPF